MSRTLQESSAKGLVIINRKTEKASRKSAAKALVIINRKTEKANRMCLADTAGQVRFYLFILVFGLCLPYLTGGTEHKNIF